MATYSQTNTKRQKIRDVNQTSNINEHFSGISRIEYRSELNNIEDTLCYYYYNSTERINGRSMEDWLRFALNFDCLFDSDNCDRHEHNYHFCQKSLVKNIWQGDRHTVENYKKKIRTCFELLLKLGIKYWTASDCHLAPQGETWDETCNNLDEIVEYVVELQTKTGVKLLSFGADLQSHTKYFHGSVTNPNPVIYSAAGQQIKKCLDVALKMGAESFLLNCSNEGYDNILVNDIEQELKNYAKFLKMTVEYKEQIGYHGQLMLETGSEKCSYQRLHLYGFDTLNILCFLKHFNLDRHFKLNVHTEHEYFMASIYGVAGILSPRQLSTIQNNVVVTKWIIEHGLSSPGGITLGCCLFPTNTTQDIFEICIIWIDMYAKALRISNKIHGDGFFHKIQQYVTSEKSATQLPSTLLECDQQSRKYATSVCSMQFSQSKSIHFQTLLERYCNNI